MKFKKSGCRLALCFLSSLCVILSGCLSVCDEQKEKKYIVFATPLADHPIWTCAKTGFEDACRDYQIEGDWIGPNIIDVTEMEQVIETAVMQSADGIITQGVVQESILAKARAAGIPVVLVDSDMNPVNRLTFIGKDFHQQAVMFLEDIENRLGQRTPLIIAIQAANLDFDIARDQIEQIQSVLKAHPGGYEIVSLSQSLSDDVRSKKEWETVLKNNPQVNVTISLAGESAVCCYDAAAQAGRDGDLLIYGVDDIEKTMRYVQEGKIAGTVVTSFYQYGYEGVELLLHYIDTKEAPCFSKARLQMITERNFDEYQKGHQTES